MNGDKDAADLAIDSNPWLVLPLDSDRQEETQDSCCEVSLLFILKLFVSRGAANLAYFNMFKNVSKKCFKFRKPRGSGRLSTVQRNCLHFLERNNKAINIVQIYGSS